MDFKVGQTFVDMYPPEAAEWCNGNRAYIIEVEKDGEHQQFQIVAYPELSLEKLKEEKKSLIDAETSAAILGGFNYAVDGRDISFQLRARRSAEFFRHGERLPDEAGGDAGPARLRDVERLHAGRRTGAPDVRCAGLPRALCWRGHEAQERDDAAGRGTQGGGGGRCHGGRG